LSVYLLTLLSIVIIKKIRTQKRRDFLLQEIQKRDELVENGHFVAVLELADKYISEFPDDTEIKAFRERLLDFTNNDPKKAQQAFVKAQKLKLTLKNYDENSELLLDNNEKTEISQLVPYNPNLKSLYTKLISYEDKKEKQQNFLIEYDRIEQLVKEKYLKEAEEKIKKLKIKYRNYEEIDILKNQIAEEQKLAMEKFESAKTDLESGKMSFAIEKLNSAISSYRDMPEGLKLENEIEKNKKISKLKLKPKNISQKPIEIFFTDEVVLGRADVNVNPDIKFTERQISRPHIKLSIIDDKLIAEDLNSSVGSFINGDKILSKSIKSGDNLNLSKVIDFKIYLQKTDGNVTGFILDGDKISYIILISELEFGFDGKDIIQEKKHKIISEEMLKLIKVEKRFILLKDQLEISFGNKKYTLEVIK
ncbi:MAG: FHA domain-containing protein, partial [Candidatus Marinimicrobia bacterium]|nr:FHA domain-containing protein [Candidatus Neomarinimicrobiota bacterium]